MALVVFGGAPVPPYGRARLDDQQVWSPERRPDVAARVGRVDRRVARGGPRGRTTACRSGAAGARRARPAGARSRHRPLPGAKPLPVAPAPDGDSGPHFHGAGRAALQHGASRQGRSTSRSWWPPCARRSRRAPIRPFRALAKGLRFYKASEPGPGNSVLYVFIVDPAVPGEDYGLGRILSQGSTAPTPRRCRRRGSCIRAR